MAGMRCLCERKSPGHELPKGAGPGVKETAAELLADKGPGIFRDCAKLHFKTWHEISGL